MAINHRQVSVTSTPVRLDLNMFGVGLSFSPRDGAIYLGSLEDFTTSDATKCRRVAQGVTVDYEDMKGDDHEQVWVAAVSGTVIIDVSDRGVNPHE